MLNNQTPNTSQLIVIGKRPNLKPVTAVDSDTNTIYDVATFIDAYKRLNPEEDPLAEKLDIYIQIVMQWVDEDAQVSTIRDMVQVLFQLRNAVAGIRICNQGGGTQ